MLVHAAYRYKLLPTEEQKAFLNQTLGSCRFVFNHYLAKAQTDYKAWEADPTFPKPPKPSVSYEGLCKSLTSLKQDPETTWLNDISSVALQQKLMDLGKAYKGFFAKKTGYPRFKSRFYKGSFRLMLNAFKLEGQEFHIAKCPSAIKVIWSRALPGTPSQLTVTKTPAGEYYVSFLVEVEKAPNPAKPTKVTGLDAGISSIAVTSDGVQIQNPRYYVKALKKLARLKRLLARKHKSSSNRQKLRLKLTKAEEHVADQRKDFLHKLTTMLVRTTGTIVIEGLQPSNMLKNHKLAMHIACAGFGMMRNMLEYKTFWSQWTNLVIADPWEPSTQLCSYCGNKPPVKIKLGVKAWTCPTCQTTHDRDVNAALNLEAIVYRPKVQEALAGKYGTIILASRWTPAEGLIQLH